MEFRTTFNIPPSNRKITYDDPAVFIGSCFSTSIGRQFEYGHLPVMINPSGTVYNPVSVCNTLSTVTDRKQYTQDDLHCYEGNWISFNHYTDFTGSDPEEVLSRINSRSDEALSFMSKAHFLFVTFGTARIYRWKQTGRIVSNCHKLPASGFSLELLSVNDIVSLWMDQLDKLHTLFPELQVIFTISPIRHWKDGAHENQISKSILFLAVEELMKHPATPGYFPAYELVMDDLRDYRFYEKDMLHLSESAVDYIWKAFTDCYLDEKTVSVWTEINKITRAMAHQLKGSARDKIGTFVQKMAARIESVEAKVPGIDLEREKKYFLDLLEH